MEAPARTGVEVETGFPGGNARLCEREDGRVRLAPETRDSTREWFYWNAAITAATAGERLIEFGDREVVGPLGPAVEDGEEWSWLGPEARVDASAFRYDFDAGERVRFAFAPPYQRADFERWYDAHASNGRLHRETLTTSECGRSVPLVRVGSGQRHVVVTCRHHSCETTASYALAGLLSALLAETPLGGDYTVHAVPMVDIDGVERGDQGKYRAPHDHNRDYVDGNALSSSLSPLYAATAAIMGYVRSLSGPLVAGLDLHCPYRWGNGNDTPFFVGDPEAIDPALSSLLDRLSAATDRRPESLAFAPEDGVQGFDGQAAAAPTFRSFVDEEGADLAATLEVPYVGTAADPVTPTSARAFGGAVAAALGEWTERK
jgi:hypothetical protein